jgi:peptide methionine sulfoxide reductase MsrA
MNSYGCRDGTSMPAIPFVPAPSTKKDTEAMKKTLGVSQNYPHPIVTEIKKAGEFYSAEEYHQKYLMKSGEKVC